LINGLIYLYQSFYLTKRTYIVGGVIVLLFATSFFLPALFVAGKLGIVVLLILLLIDMLLLYAKRRALLAARVCQERFSNGDENKVVIQLHNNYSFTIDVELIDELPPILQQRNWAKKLSIKSNTQEDTEYTIKPVVRGEYMFGKIQAFVTSPLQLIQRRFSFPADETVLVYPSYVQMRKYNLVAMANSLQDAGTKRIRKLGNSVEFEQIKDYVRGDDYRTINWKATARKGQLMVNTYVDEKSQQVFCILDKSRNMKMPFEGMTLLDYAVNAALVLTNVALQKQDKAGLITFAEKMDTFLAAERYSMQMENVLEALYNQQTKFLDADYENLYSHIRSKIKQRSLLILFTNFESQYALERQLPYLRKIAHHHLLVVVMFENTEIKSLLASDVENTEDVYIKTIADKFAYEKRLIAKELQKYGIVTILTTPEQLTVTTVNKYLEIKSRQAI